MGKDWGWTDLTYDHIKDWVTLPDMPPPDPKKYESGGLLQNWYNMLPDWMTGTGAQPTPTPNDISGLSASQRLKNVSQQQYDQSRNLPSIPNQSPMARTLQKATGIGADPDPKVAFAREHPYLATAGEFLTGYPFANPGSETGPVDLLGQFAPIAHGLTKIAEAGLPFMLLNKGKAVYHGTPGEFETFDPSRYDKDDVLGWMTHAASDPDYAEKYATGEMKHGYDAEKYATGEMKHGYEADRGAPNIIPIHSEAKNVLDLVDPNADDIAHALAALDPWKRREYIEHWKNARKDPNFARGYELKSSHYPFPSDIPDEEVPARVVADKLHLNPEEFARTQFDAIKYRDVGKESWAFPEGTPLKSAVGGVPLTKEPAPIKVTRAPHGTPVSSSELSPVKKKTTHYRDAAVDALYGKPSPPDPLGETENWGLPEDITDDLAKASPSSTGKSKLQIAKDKFAESKVSNEKINASYSNWKVEGMETQAEMLGIDITQFENYLEMEKYLEQVPMTVPGHGKLTKMEAQHLAAAGELPWSVYYEHFPW